MKKLLLILGAIIVLLLPLSVLTGCMCSPASMVPYRLEVSIAQQPVGGQNVNTLTCKYSVAYKVYGTKNASGKWIADVSKREADAPLPVTLKATWINDKGGTYNPTEKTFSVDSTGGTYTTTWSVPQAGLFFDKTFWVRFEWNDISGGHKVESAMAVCTVK